MSKIDLFWTNKLKSFFKTFTTGLSYYHDLFKLSLNLEHRDKIQKLFAARILKI